MSLLLIQLILQLQRLLPLLAEQPLLTQSIYMKTKHQVIDLVKLFDFGINLAYCYQHTSKQVKNQNCKYLHLSFTTSLLSTIRFCLGSQSIYREKECFSRPSKWFR